MDRAATHFPIDDLAGDDRSIGAAQGRGRGADERRPKRSAPIRAWLRLKSRLWWQLSSGVVCVGLLLGLFLGAAQAANAELGAFDVSRTEEGVLLNYAINVELSHSVDDALGKAVPLYFVAEAEIYRNRWYWRDLRVAHAQRIWKIVFQPLTSTYRVTFGGLSQSFDSRDEALDSITRGARWKIAEPGQVAEGGSYYLEFSFRLDTSQLPRPMQIGIGGQPEWAISVRRSQRIN